MTKVQPRLPVILTLAAMTALTLPAAGPGRIASLSRGEAERMLSGVVQHDTTAAMWIWTDKLVYQPGEALTLRWTIRPHGDLYPYTFVAYRQNNQTGARSFLPNLTAEATGCSKRDVTVVSSEFKRKGFETAWCAQCKDKRYQCVTNADRTRVECFEAKEGGPCL